MTAARNHPAPIAQTGQRPVRPRPPPLVIKPLNVTLTEYREECVSPPVRTQDDCTHMYWRRKSARGVAVPRSLSSLDNTSPRRSTLSAPMALAVPADRPTLVTLPHPGAPKGHLGSRPSSATASSAASSRGVLRRMKSALPNLRRRKPPRQHPAVLSRGLTHHLSLTNLSVLSSPGGSLEGSDEASVLSPHSFASPVNSPVPLSALSLPPLETRLPYRDPGVIFSPRSRPAKKISPPHSIQSVTSPRPSFPLPDGRPCAAAAVRSPVASNEFVQSPEARFANDNTAAGRARQCHKVRVSPNSTAHMSLFP